MRSVDYFIGYLVGAVGGLLVSFVANFVFNYHEPLPIFLLSLLGGGLLTLLFWCVDDGKFKF